MRSALCLSPVGSDVMPIINDVSTVKNGPHTLAKAADILISGERAMQLFEKARHIGFSGIGLNQKGQHHKRFIHLDTVDRRALWNY